MRDQLANIELLALLVRGDTAAAARHVSGRKLDFAALNQFAARHRVAGLLSTLLGDTELSTRFPTEVLEGWKAAYLRQWINNERLLEEAERLSPRLNDLSPPPLFLNGPFLAQQCYGDIGSRNISNLDILVARQDDVERAHRLLTSLGYQRESMGRVHGRFVSRFGRRYRYRREHLDLDLHWALQRHFSFAIDYERISVTHAILRRNGRRCRVTSGEYELVLQLLSIFADMQSGTVRLSSFVDVYMILSAIERRADWGAFFTRRKAEGLFLISLNVLVMVLDLFACRADFARLAGCIEQHQRCLCVRDISWILEYLDVSRRRLRGKLRAVRLYQAPLLACAAWWLGSLPFQAVLHRGPPASTRE